MNSRLPKVSFGPAAFWRRGLSEERHQRCRLEQDLDIFELIIFDNASSGRSVV